MARLRVTGVVAAFIVLVMVGSSLAVFSGAPALAASPSSPSLSVSTSTGSPPVAVAPGAPVGAAATPVSASTDHFATDAARANLVNKARQAFIDNGVSLNDFFPPNLNAAPGSVSATGGHIVPLYNYAAAPLGISTFGLENTTGTTTPYILNTTSLLGTFSTSDPEGLQVLSPYYGTLQAYGDQLNTVLNSTTILGNASYDYWLQNVITYNTATSTLSFENNIWNFSSPSGIFPSNSILHGLGHVEEEEVYEESGPSMTIAYPFTLDLYLNTTVGNYAGSPGVNEVYFNYSVFNGVGTHVCPTIEPTGEVCGMYDNVYFNSATPGSPSINVAKGSAEISANGKQYTPLGLPSDMEMDVGIGQSDGANANVVYSNATVGLYVLNASSGKYQAPPSTYDFGSETGETGVGAFTTWNVVNGQPVAYLRTGPSLLVGLWNVTGTTGAPTIGGGARGALALDYAGVSPGNAFIAIAQGTGVTNQSFFQVAPTFGWFSGKGEIGQNIWLSPGPYTVEVMLSGYYQANLNIYLHYSGQPLTVALSQSATPTVYTPLWAYSNSDLANLSVSGSGTSGSPYVLPGSQPGSISPVFAVLNDYLFIVYSGIWVNATSAYFQFNPPPSLEIMEPSWWYFQTETLAAAYGGTLGYNQLPIYFYHTTNFVVENGADIGLWSSDIEVGHDYAVYCNVCTNSLFAGNHFNVSSEGLEYLGTGVAPASGFGHNYVWGNTFAPFSLPGEDTGSPTYAYGGMSLPSTGLTVSQSLDWIYNNAFYTNGTASSSASSRTCSGCTFTNFWNATGGYQPATNSITVNGVSLTGSILGQPIQGGNFWFNYGTVADPFGVPYVARATSPTGTPAIAKNADLAPLSTYMNVALATTVPTALGVGLYPVTFTESGLSIGNSWTVRIVGVPVYEPLTATTLTTNPTNTTTVSASLTTNILWVPNGTYVWHSTTTAAGLAALGGSITVSGASAAATVTFKAAPVVTLSPPTTTTQVGGSVVYAVGITGGLAPITWTLQSNQPGSPTNLSAETFTATTSGIWTVYLNATDAGGRTSHATATVTVKPALVATLSPGTATTQVGGSVIYTVGTTGGVAPIVWTLQSNQPGSPSNLSSETFSASTQGSWTVYLNATDAVGSTSDVTATVTVNAALVAALSPGTSTTQVGGSVAYTISSTGGVAPITWTLQSNQPGSPSNLSGSLFTGTSAGAWTVYLNATDAVGSTSDTTAAVTVEPALVATLSPGSTTTNVGDSVVYTVGTAGGVAPVTWTLQSNEPGSPSNLSGETFVATTTGTWTVYLNSTDVVGSVSDTTATVTVLPAPTYSVTFTESGLAAGLKWKVTVNGVTKRVTAGGGSDHLTFSGLVNGSYGYTISGNSGWYQSTLPYHGTVTVNGAPVTEPTAVYTELTYSVTFSEKGLPSGLTWQVTVYGITESLTTTGGTDSLTWNGLVNGTYAYSIGGNPGWYEPTKAYNGTVTVRGHSLTEKTYYSEKKYTVTFSESGLPSGLTWRVTVDGMSKSLVTNGGTDSLTWSLANNTYAYTIHGVSGWTQSTLPPSGTVVVNGAAVTEPTIVYT